VFDLACTPDKAKTSTVCEDAESKGNPISGQDGVLFRATVIAALISGGVAVIMMIAGGFMIVTAGGDTNKVANGRRTLIYASVGLVVVAAGQSIIIFVINSL